MQLAKIMTGTSIGAGAIRGLSPSAIRYYEKAGLLAKPLGNPGGAVMTRRWKSCSDS